MPVIEFYAFENRLFIKGRYYCPYNTNARSLHELLSKINQTKLNNLKNINKRLSFLFEAKVI